jgi:hypothetical protein
LHAERRSLEEEAGAEFDPKVSDYQHGSRSAGAGAGAITGQLYGMVGFLRID